ncbi:T9SS C-terminal target domain-containing protein [Chryseobacterium arthrosphaerae]|uniref:T9SS type A sorting domain-containing protein n=1 Tax=Chryseobacterium arthrosphaerae TaxID=651561 RepID=UPI000F510F48|nr:T9SS type A sorting domain-containing protein [Chryseobacterium arthrosphaerae]AYZ14651.1 T9SS C-terminal target domain-containing protein [Chryseobacterium arthrosphaerae]MDG4652327.1 T9SS type A sorting domain-containing protein [Chryseobacterium arthrosphaerae]
MKKILLCLFLLTAALINAQNDDCTGAIALTVGTDFASGAATFDNTGATTDGPAPSCQSNTSDNLWFTAIVPASGKLTIETREVSGSLFGDSVVTVFSGSCGSLAEIECDDDNGNGGFSSIFLTGQTPGAILYISVGKYYLSDNGEFQLSAYDPIPPAHDVCSGAIALTVGTDFNSGAITTNNYSATTDGSTPSCDPDAIDNVWFTAVVPQSGNLTIKLKEASGPTFFGRVVNVYRGSCNSLTEITCNNLGFPPTVLTGLIPGETVYISVWKYDSYSSSGEFQIAAYDPILPANDECSGATPLTVGGDFNSGAIISGNDEATTDGSSPSCLSTAINNVWFTVTVPPSGNLKIETQSDPGSNFNYSTLSVYSGTCGSLTEIACDNNSGQGFFSLLSLTGQTPGEILYASVWQIGNFTDSGTFQISAYDENLLSTHEVTDSKKKIMVSPNPFSDVLTISDISDVQSVSVADAAGRMVKTIEKPSSSLDLRDLKEGLYFVTLKMKDGSVKTIKSIKK